MPLFKYKPYYKYNGPTLAQPFREELDSDEIEECIEGFYNEVESYFNDIKDGYIEISANITQDDCDQRVKNCLNFFDLYANRIVAVN